jgi:hypothetical protein
MSPYARKLSSSSVSRGYSFVELCLHVLTQLPKKLGFIRIFSCPE